MINPAACLLTEALQAGLDRADVGSAAAGIAEGGRADRVEDASARMKRAGYAHTTCEKDCDADSSEPTGPHRRRGRRHCNPLFVPTPGATTFTLFLFCFETDRDEASQLPHTRRSTKRAARMQRVRTDEPANARA